MDQYKNQTKPHHNRADQLRIKHLRLLELIDEHKSLAAVAGVLHLSQPTVTGMVQALESVFGVTLVNRSLGGGRLTEAGALALRQLRVTLAAFDAALDSATHTPVLPLVRLGVLPLIGAWLFPQAMAHLENQGVMPRLSVMHGGVTALFTALDNGAIDCAVCHLDELLLQVGHLSDLHIEPLHAESRLFACSPTHPLASRTSLKLADLLGEQWILPPRTSQVRRIMERVFLNAGLTPPQPLIESFAAYSNLQTVAVTQMLTFAPTTFVLQHTALGLIHVLPITDNIPVSRLAFLARKPILELPGVDALRQAFLWAAANRYPPQINTNQTVDQAVNLLRPETPGLA